MLAPGNSWKSHCVGQPCGLRTLTGFSLAVGRFCGWYLQVHTHYTQNSWFLINQMVTCPLRGNNPSLWRGNRACFGPESIKSSPGFGSSVLTITLASGSRLSPLNHFDSARGDVTHQQSKGDLDLVLPWKPPCTGDRRGEGRLSNVCIPDMVGGREMKSTSIRLRRNIPLQSWCDSSVWGNDVILSRINRSMPSRMREVIFHSSFYCWRGYL